MLDSIFAERTLDEWSEVFRGEPDFFWAPVNTPDDLLADPAFHPSRAPVDVPADVPPVAIDPNQFKQVFVNLFNNAIDAGDTTVVAVTQHRCTHTLWTDTDHL